MTSESLAPDVLHVWALYLRAGEEARCRGDRRIGTEHLVLALLADPSAETMLGVGVAQARQAVEALDQQALGALGMGSDFDVPTLTMRDVAAKPKFRDVATKNRMRLTPAAKAVLEEAVRPNRHKLHCTAQQLLAAILTRQSPDPAAALLGALGVNAFDVKRRLGALAAEV